MYGMKLSIKEAFKSAFRIFGQNFFVILASMVFWTILTIILFAPILVSIGILDYSTMESVNVFKASDKLSMPNQLLFQCVRFFLLNMVSFLLVSAFLPAFEGSKIKFRNYFPNFKKVFKAF